MVLLMSTLTLMERQQAKDGGSTPAIPMEALWMSSAIGSAFEKVKLGMTLEQVEAILGGPGRKYSDILQESRGFTEVYNDPAERYLYWNFSDGVAEVVMRDGK